MDRQADVEFAPDAVVYDADHQKVGRCQGRGGPYLLLRPLGGGWQWEANPESVRLATSGERLSAELRAVNASWQRRPDR